MAPKPFGKPIPGRHRIPRLAMIALILMAASPVAYLALSSPSRSYRTLVADALYWPSAVVFGAFLATAGFLWMKDRPAPHGPGEGVSTGHRAGQVFLALILAAPFALAGAFLYQPGLSIVNGSLSMG